MAPMRIALVSPYSWTYPGGVTRHIEALAEHYLAAGHEVRVLSRRAPRFAVDLRPHVLSQHTLGRRAGTLHQPRSELRVVRSETVSIRRS